MLRDHNKKLDCLDEVLLQRVVVKKCKPELGTGASAEWIEDPKQARHDHHQPIERVRAPAQISQGRKDLGQKIKKRLDEGS